MTLKELMMAFFGLFLMSFSVIAAMKDGRNTVKSVQQAISLTVILMLISSFVRNCSG